MGCLRGSACIQLGHSGMGAAVPTCFLLLQLHFRNEEDFLSSRRWEGCRQKLLSSPVAEFIWFRCLAAESGWNKEAQGAFQNGINENNKDELVSHAEPEGLDNLSRTASMSTGGRKLLR